MEGEEWKGDLLNDLFIFSAFVFLSLPLSFHSSLPPSLHRSISCPSYQNISYANLVCHCSLNCHCLTHSHTARASEAARGTLSPPLTPPPPPSSFVPEPLLILPHLSFSSCLWNSHTSNEEAPFCGTKYLRLSRFPWCLLLANVGSSVAATVKFQLHCNTVAAAGWHRQLVHIFFRLVRFSPLSLLKMCVF